MVIIFDKDAALRQGISGAGNVLGNVLMQQGLQNQQRQFQNEQLLKKQKYEEQQEQKKIDLQKKYGTILSSVTSNLPERPSAIQLISSFQNALNQGVPVDIAIKGFEPYQEFIKQGVRQEADMDILKSLGLLPGSPPTQEEQRANQIGSTPEYQETSTPPSQNPIQNWSEDQLVLAQVSNVPALQKMADAEIKRRDLDQKRFHADRDYESKFSQNIAKEYDALSNKLQKKKLASAMSREAIESDAVGPISMANIGERLGIPELQTARGAQLAQATKVNLVSNLSDVSARAQNMWMERMLSTAFPGVGKPRISNLVLQESIEAEIKMDEAKLKASQEIQNKDLEKYGYVKWSTLNNRVDNAIEDTNKDILNEVSYKTRKLYEQEQGPSWLQKNWNKKVPKGTPLTPEMSAVFFYNYSDDLLKNRQFEDLSSEEQKEIIQKVYKNAQKLGYRIPSREEVSRWQ